MRVIDLAGPLFTAPKPSKVFPLFGEIVQYGRVSRSSTHA
jgi:hypothetical protein